MDFNFILLYNMAFRIILSWNRRRNMEESILLNRRVDNNALNHARIIWCYIKKKIRMNIYVIWRCQDMNPSTAGPLSHHISRSPRILEIGHSQLFASLVLLSIKGTVSRDWVEELMGFLMGNSKTFNIPPKVFLLIVIMLFSSNTCLYCVVLYYGSGGGEEPAVIGERE